MAIAPSDPDRRPSRPGVGPPTPREGRRGTSGPLLWPVAGPAYIGRDGPGGELVTVSPGTRWLSAGQRTLLWAAERKIGRRGEWTTTLEEISALLGSTSRGRTRQQLARLRQLGRLGFRTVRGRRGHTVVWLPAAALDARRRWSGPRRRSFATGNDSPSSIPRYIGAHGWRRSWSSGGPPGAGGNDAAGARPPAGVRRAPPRVLYSRCPAGHRSRLGRRSWRWGSETVSAEWAGRCHRCARPFRELVTLQLALPEPRPVSAAELADPGLRLKRQAAAAAIVSDPSTSRSLREQLTRDYLSPPLAATIPAAGTRGDRRGPR